MPIRLVTTDHSWASQQSGTIVSPRFVRALESGKETVRIDKLVDVLDVLGLELTASLRTAL